jgi:hypothetical protein
MILLILVLLALAAFVFVGYRMVATGTSTRVANGVLLLVLAVMLVALFLGSLSFDAGI